MDFKTQLSGLNELLAVIYGNGTQLDMLLRDLGFEQAQVDQLRDRHLEVVVDQFLEMIHKRLTSESGKDTYYQILSRRYGLDGESPDSLEAISEKRNDSPAYLRQLFQEILKRCQGKTAQADFKKGLQQIAVAQLGKMERPTRAHVAEKLERLSNLRGAADVTRLDYEAKRATILKQVQAELDALEAEYKPLLESVDENIASLETEIKTDVLLHGESVQGGTFRAVYTKGRTSWDNNGIEKYAELHPDVLLYRKQGPPSVSLRIVDAKD
jgi:DNA-directed RNA polymerase sigma subunit (sigma70/sigma32)